MKFFSERSLELVLNSHIMNNSKKLIHDKYIEYVKSKNERNKKMYVNMIVSAAYIPHYKEIDQCHVFEPSMTVFMLLLEICIQKR